MIETIGKYRILRLLGEGAMGAVYLAEDPDIGRQVAIKVMKVEAEEDHERFRQEARIVGGLSHPNIVVLHDFGFHEGKPYLVMQYLPGTSLEDWLQSAHGLPEHLRIMDGLVSALDYAHGRGVLHRDLKPSNVQVTPEGDGRLMDFGIARVPEAKLTATGTIMGTPAYMAPEILGDAQYSTRADHYSAALVLYEMLAGRNPFLGQTISSTLTNVLHLEPPDLATLRGDVPGELSAAIMAHLAKDPRRRPADLTALLAVLRALRSGAPLPGPSVAAPPREHGAGATQSIQDLRARLQPPGGKPPAAPVEAVAPAAQAQEPAGPGRRWLLAALAIAVVAVLAWVGTRSTSPPVEAPSPMAQALAPSTTTLPAAEPAQASAEVDRKPAPTPQPVPTQAPPTRPPAAQRSARPTPATTTLAPAAVPPRETSPTPAPAATATPPVTTLALAVQSPTPAPIPTPQATPTARVEAPAMPTLTELSPRTCRRGNVTAFDLRGTGFRSEHKVRILRGGREVPGLRITRQSLEASGHLRITLFVGADVPLGSYSVVLADPSGSLSDAVSFEVVL